MRCFGKLGGLVLLAVTLSMGSTASQAATYAMPRQSGAATTTVSSRSTLSRRSAKKDGTATSAHKWANDQPSCGNHVVAQPGCCRSVGGVYGSLYRYPIAYPAYGYTGYRYNGYAYPGVSYPILYASDSSEDPQANEAVEAGGRTAYELGHDWGQDLRREVVTWSDFVTFLKVIVPQLVGNDLMELSRGFAGGYGSNAQAAFEKAMRDAELQSAEPPVSPGPKVITFPPSASSSSD